MDVLDPSIYPGTGTPEPGGIDYTIGGLKQLKAGAWWAWAVWSWRPVRPHRCSAITMAKTLREMIILASWRKR